MDVRVNWRSCFGGDGHFSFGSWLDGRETSGAVRGVAGRDTGPSAG